MDDTRRGSADEAAIRKLVENWVSAVRAKDLSGILHHHSRDILMFDVAPPFQSNGLEEYRKTWDLFFAWAHEPVAYNIKEMNITAGSDVAFVAAHMQCAGGESRVDDELDFRLTIGLRKIDGLWTIIHEHHSVPATPT